MSIVLGVLATLLLAGAVGFVLAFRRENRPDRILGLLYHRLVTDTEYEQGPPTEKIFSVTEDRFREQMVYLKSEGYNAITMGALVDYLRDGTTLPPKPFLLTFDDGSVSVYEKAFPILKELEIPAILFVTTDPKAWVFSLGNHPQRRVTSDEMRELQSSDITIGSHGTSHGALESMSREEVLHELGESKRFLEEVLGQEVRYFGVPLNWYGPKVRAVAESLGYQAVCTSDNGTIHGDSDLFHLRRFIIEGSFTLDEFARNLRPEAIVQRRLINAIKRVPARLLGPRIWLPLRRRLFAGPLGRYFGLKYFKRLLATAAVMLVLIIMLLVWWIVGP